MGSKVLHFFKKHGNMELWERGNVGWLLLVRFCMSANGLRQQPISLSLAVNPS